MRREGLKRLHFDLTWLKEEGCETIVASAWNRLREDSSLGEIFSLIEENLAELSHWKGTSI